MTPRCSDCRHCVISMGQILGVYGVPCDAPMLLHKRFHYDRRQLKAYCRLNRWPRLNGTVETRLYALLTGGIMDREAEACADFEDMACI